MDHQPEFLDLRGGPRTAGLISDSEILIIDHVDILGRAELNVQHGGSYLLIKQELILKIASGSEDIEQSISSDIQKYADRIAID